MPKKMGNDNHQRNPSCPMQSMIAVRQGRADCGSAMLRAFLNQKAIEDIYNSCCEYLIERKGTARSPLLYFLSFRLFACARGRPPDFTFYDFVSCVRPTSSPNICFAYMFQHVSSDVFKKHFRLPFCLQKYYFFLKYANVRHIFLCDSVIV